MIINLNGQIVTPEEAKVPVLDHGFLYGASVYESLRTYGGKPFLLDSHLTRLRESADGIGLKLPWTDLQLKGEVLKTLAATGFSETSLRLMVTYGVGDLGYSPTLCTAPSFILLAYPWIPSPAELYEQGVKISLVSVRRNLASAMNPAVKSGNLLNSMLAWTEAQQGGAYEALMLNYRGELAECAMSNLLLAKNNVLKTPAAECGILLGLTRSLVLEIARMLPIEVSETSLRPEDLYGADEAFLTVTSREIIPVVRCDHHKVGSGNPGPLTRLLHERYREKVEELMKREG